MEDILLKSNLIEKIDSFDCLICFNLSRNPLECLQCGQTYCKQCQGEWFKSNGSFLCLKCEGTQMLNLNKLLQEEYNNLKYRCECGQVFLLQDLQAHQKMCKMPNCKYHSFCNKKVSEYYQDKQLCGTVCLIFELCQQTTMNQKQLYTNMIDILQKKSRAQSSPLKPLISLDKNYHGKQVQIQQSNKQPLKKFSGYQFKWDQRINFKGDKIEIKDNGMTAILKESPYIFKSVVSDLPFQSGKHYFEIEVLSLTENELKIGVVINNTFNKQSAFCDLDDGFAYYTLGKLRNGSNAKGDQYGAVFKNSGTCGVYLDMGLGILAFSYNGVPLGIAFKNEKLQRAPIYASVSMLHCAGFTLKSGLQTPDWADKISV